VEIFPAYWANMEKIPPYKETLELPNKILNPQIEKGC
jgi:hypothetical protein